MIPPTTEFNPLAETHVVFTHPNHELAVYGLLQRLKPNIVYLTDGGGEERLAQTREGLRAIGLLDRARFLDYTEQSFYDALLRRDVGFYREIALRTRAAIGGKPAQVLCDALEFYNPVHDMAVPVAGAALGKSSKASLFEIPLIHQSAENPDAYRTQRPMAHREAGQVLFRLTPPELAAKRHARDVIYTLLHGQLGPLLSELEDDCLALETLIPADLAAAKSPPACTLRYERRAQLLKSRGEITDAIGYREHFMPLFHALAMEGE